MYAGSIKSKKDILNDSNVLYEGWTLYERLQASVFSKQCNISSDDKILKWQNVIAPKQVQNFEKRINWSGYTLAQAAWALSPPSDAVPIKPKWFFLLNEMRKACINRANSTTNISKPRSSPPVPFEDLWLPICNWALQELRSRLGDSILENVHADVFESLLFDLLNKLSNISQRVLYELFCEFRGAGSTLLAGIKNQKLGYCCEVKQEYSSFITQHLDDGLVEITNKYPVMGRLISVALGNWFETNQELLERIYLNSEDLSRVFGFPVHTPLINIEHALSDPHHGGRSVVVLSFSLNKEQKWKIVYKPRNMNVDFTYQSYLQYLNELSAEVVFKTLKILPVEDYGFMEFVEHLPCDNDGDLDKFYHNAGRLLAVLYILGCNDCHNENLIATRDKLVLIDVETLLQGYRDDVIEDGKSEKRNLEHKISQSVLRVGLLPEWRVTSANDYKKAIDGSALGIQPPQHSTMLQPGWTSINSDEMHWGQVAVFSIIPKSCPIIIPRINILNDFKERICTGFATQIEQFMRHKETLLSKLELFSGLSRRVVTRPTQTYAVIQLQALEPSSLKTSFARGLRLEQLSRSYIISDDKPFDWLTFESEVQQMENLDIPYFEQKIDSDVMELPYGMGKIRGFLKTTGLAASKNRLTHLSREDIDFQLQLIRGTLEASQLKSDSVSDKKNNDKNSIVSDNFSQYPSKELRIKDALKLGLELQNRILYDQEGSAEWLGLEVGKDQERFKFGLVGASLYSGRGGIALFMSNLAHKLEREIGFENQTKNLRKDAKNAVQSILNLTRSYDEFSLFRWVRDQPLGLSGVGGLILNFLLLDDLEEHPEHNKYIDVANIIAIAITPDIIQSEKAFDIVSGSAGLIGSLLKLSRSVKASGKSDEAIIATAIRCGEHLVEKQLSDGSWPNIVAKKSLTGFSHGTAGISAALAQLYKVSGINSFLKSARMGLEYERRHFSIEHNNWPDFRVTDLPVKFMNSWCHGAPGIALSRICLRNTELWDKDAEQELSIALSATVNAEQATVDTLCCGVFGRASILRIATAHGLGSNWGIEAERMINNHYSSAGHLNTIYKLHSMVDGNALFPGLFTGIAGIGMAIISSDDLHIISSCLSSGLLETQNRIEIINRSNQIPK